MGIIIDFSLDASLTLLLRKRLEIGSSYNKIVHFN
jgi:hypothetical protein